MARRIPSIVPAAFGALIVLAFILAVGRPNVFTDTRDYMIHGARFYQALHRTFLGEKPPIPKTPEEQRAWIHQQAQTHFDHSNVGARSPYYGILLYTTAHRGTLWLLTAVQALCCSWLLYLLWRSMTPAAPEWTYYALMAALAVGTSLPWVAGFAVPDIFAAVLTLAAALLLFYRDRLARWEQAGAWLLMAAAIAFHGSHVLLGLCFLPVAYAFGWLLKADKAATKRFMGLAAAAVAVSMAATWIYGQAVKWHTGDELRRPPFLIARVLADGPGRDYLRYSCDRGAPWVICRFRNLPLNDSDKILWSALPETGVFNRANYEDRVRMEEQELSFVIGTVAHDPFGQVAASLDDWWTQLTSYWVDDPLRRPMAFLTHSYWGKTNLVGLLRGAGDCGREGELCQPKVRISDLATVDGGVLLISLLALSGALFWSLLRPASLRVLRPRPLRWDDDASRAIAVALFLAGAVVLNAAVCGVFSGPFPRYQARIVWLLPAEALLLPMALVPAHVWSRWRLVMPADVRQSWADAFAGAQALRARGQALAEGLWAWGLARSGPLGARIDPAFLRFGVVGATGFTVDAAILHAMIDLFGFNYFTGRLISFTTAIFVTWFLNRRWTFKVGRSGAWMKEVALYFGVQGVGGVANIGVYTAAIVAAPVLKHWLLIPLAMGSAAGLCLTFAGAKHLAFRTPRPGMPGAAGGVAADTSAV